MAKRPIWSDEELSRLLGARDGIVQALLAVRSMRERFHSQYRGNFHPRHVRKIAERDAITAPLRELEASLDADQKRCMEAYEREYDRAHPLPAVGSPSHPEVKP
jgi:hypothetical protein